MDVEAYILVGGRSSRFAGGEKPLAEMNGRTLAQRALETVRKALPRSKIVFVARDAEQFAAEAAPVGAFFIYDTIEDRGPVGGLHTALSNCESDWVFLFACDMPFVGVDIIRKLWAARDPHSAVILPRQSNGRLQPLCAFYNVARVRPLVSEILNRKGKTPAMMALIDALPAKVIEKSNSEAENLMWSNLNTAEELHAAAEIERKLSGPTEI